MKDWVVVSIPSQAKYLSVVRAATVNIGKLYGMDGPVIEDVRLAVDEACSNVIKHAYKGNASKKIVIKYRTTQDRFEVIIEDSGMKGRMELMKGRSLDDIRPGGLGIHFIRRVFDVFKFDEKKKNGNRLILIKYIKGNG
jgi:anti-sigma regulatory factor (Ser/Thr protein kinase)